MKGIVKLLEIDALHYKPYNIYRVSKGVTFVEKVSIFWEAVVERLRIRYTSIAVLAATLASCSADYLKNRVIPEKLKGLQSKEAIDPKEIPLPWEKHPGTTPSCLSSSETPFKNKVKVKRRLRKIASEDAKAEAQIDKAPILNLKKAFLELTPSFQGTSIRISDSLSGPSATFSSRMNFGLSARYIQAWSDRFHTFLGFGLNYVNFQVPQTGSKTLSESSALMTSMSAGGRLFFSDQTFFTLLLAQQQELFIRATSSTNFAVSTLPVYSFNGRLDQNLFQVQPFTIGVAGEASVYFATQGDSYTASSGTGFGGILYLKQGKNYDGFQSEIRFFSRKQNTTGVEQSEQNLSLILRFFFPVGLRTVEE